jgi:hypothetical protein
MIRMRLKVRPHLFCVALGVIGLMLMPEQSVAAAKTYNSKGNQENTRNMFETCRLKKAERDAEGTRCIYRRQSKGNDVVISNDSPNVSCQRQFQCKREQ